MLKIFEYSG